MQEFVDVSAAIQKLASCSHWKAEPFNTWGITNPYNDHEIS